MPHPSDMPANRCHWPSLHARPAYEYVPEGIETVQAFPLFRTHDERAKFV
ncbi:hypothetical protein Mal33_04500 [Rosistilla oblonga]|uniref:Uncharacterized protein n=1 Tax=Rosistilla oblonga TaxID=2527990 RepID=A0A518IN25_9BACT|nr:hypothetical protein Mal33_04500 [Rosistilla oblonga]